MKEIYLPILPVLNYFKIYNEKNEKLKRYRMNFLFVFLIFLFADMPVFGQLTKDIEPTSLTTCQPSSNTSFTTSFTVGKGPGCDKLNDKPVTFTWKYSPDNVTFNTVANNTPVGFITYTKAFINNGPSGNPTSTTNTLTITLSSSAVPGTYYYKCEAFQPGGCTQVVTSGPITFTVYALPVPTFTTQPGASACLNTDVTYTTQSGQTGYTWGIPGTSGTNYTITGGSITSNTVTLKWLTAGNKTVTINYTNSNGCTAATPTSSTATAAVTLIPTFTAQPSGTVCSGTNQTYTTQSGSGESNYIWNVPGVLNTDYSITSGGTGTGNSTVTLKWLTASAGRVVTINYTKNGCTAASPTSSNSVMVTASPVPTFTASPAASTCSQTDITYTTQSGGSNYIWVVPGTLGTDYTITAGGTGTSSNTVTLKWLTAGSKTVTVNYTATGCTGLIAASSSTTVTLRPVATFTVSPGANTCAGTNVTYTTQSSQSNYIWTVEGTSGIDYNITGGSTGSNTVTIQWLTSGSNRTVTVNYTGGGSCTSLIAASSTTLINALPNPTFTTSAAPITCANTDVAYTTQATQTNYTWTVPGTAGIDYTIIAGGTGTGSNTVTLQWITAGSKTVTVGYTNSNGCIAATPASSITTVNIPVIPTIAAGGPTTFCLGSSVVLTSSAAATYQWYNNGIIIAGATGNTYTATTTASYTVKTTNASGCDATSAGTVVTINPLPAINIAAQATSLCFSAGAQTSTLAYADVDNAPTTYSITWDAAATTAGFTAVTNAALPASPINIAVPAGAPANTYTGTITVKNANGCTSISKTFTVTITTAPAVSNFNVAAASGCAGTGAVITVTSSTLVNGTYTVTYDLSGANTATGNTKTMIFTGGTGTFTAAALNVGSTDISITQIALVGCSAIPSANTTTFTINALPAVSPITGASGVCIGNIITLSDATTGGTWSSDDIIVATVNGTGVVTGITAGSADIIYTTAPVSGCTNKATKNIAVYALPTVTAITGTTTLCISSTTNLDNATAGGIWKSSNIAVATVNGSGLVTGIAAGTSIIKYILPANGNGCTDSTNVTVTVDPAAAVNAGAGLSACQSASPTTITLSGATIGGAATTGAWSIVSGGGTLSSTAQTANPSGVSYTPAINFSGIVTLLLTTNAPGSCPSVTSSRTITVSQAPIATAGGPNTVCQSASPAAITLTGATLGGGATTGAWSIASGSGTLSDNTQTSSPEIITFTPAANFSGVVSLTLTTNTVGPCAAATASRTINVAASAIIVSGGPNTVCKASPAITLTGASIGGGSTTAAWSISSGGGTLSSIAFTATPASVTYTPAAAFTGTVTLTLTSDIPAGCSSASITRTINVSNPATVNASGPNTACQSASPSAITLTGALIGGGATTGTWSIISGGGMLSDLAPTSTPAAVTYTPAANYTGGITLRLTTDVPGGCAVATADRTINVTIAPISNAGTAILTCSDVAQTSSGVAAVNITAGSSATNNTSVLWSSSGTGTFANPTSLTTATYTPSAADKSAGSVTLTLTAFGNSPCGTATSTKTFTITPAVNTADANSWTQLATCLGQGVIFTLPAPPGGGNGTFSYQWMHKNNCGVAGVSIAVPGATDLSFVPPDGDCYWLFITSGGCLVPPSLVSSTNRQRVDAAIAATSNVSFGVGGNNPAICIGESTVITAQSAVPYNYSWSPATALSTTTGATVTANPTTTTVYTVTATSIADPTCSKSAIVTVTVSPVTIPGTLPTNISVCTTGSNTINLAGNNGVVTRWESSTDGGSTWTPIANTSTSLPITVATQTTLYRALVQSGACSSAYSTIATAGLHNVWLGTVSTDWQTAANWSDGLLPSTSCPNVLIQNVTNKPVLGSGSSTITNLIIQASAKLTINNTGLLQIGGTITNSGTFDVSNGTLDFNGSPAQSIAGSMFLGNNIKNLTVSNTNAGGVTITGAGIPLNITGDLAFGNLNNVTLNTGDNIVLKSTATSTARVADITNNNPANNNNKFVGKVTVERFYPAKRSWRLVTSPLSNTGNIFNSWQAGAPVVYVPGQGMFVTGLNPTGSAGNGLDYSYQNNYSMKGWDAATNNYINIGNTKTQLLSTATATAANIGFFTFVRGDRNRSPDNAVIPNTNNTLLSSIGNLQTGTQVFTAASVNNKFTLIGNPYASPVDFSKITRINVVNRFIVWDPKLNDVGGFVVFQDLGNTGTYSSDIVSPGGQDKNIQSSQAFFVQTIADGVATVVFDEPDKSTANNLGMFRPVPAAQSKDIRINLYKFHADNTSYLADGIFAEFDDSYSPGVTIEDAVKFSNINETFGLLRNNKLLAIERRPTIKITDTLFLKLTKTSQRKYRFTFITQKLEQDNLAGFIEDGFLNKSTPINLNGNTTVDFELTSDAASAVSDRFRVVFKPSVTYTGISAMVLNSDIAVHWDVANEYNIKEYEIERSTNGINFIKMSTKLSLKNDNSNALYEWLDVAPSPGYYYYRIHSISYHNASGYSDIVKVKINKSTPAMYVFPNPVTDNYIQLQINSMPQGIYYIRLINILGQEIINKFITHTVGTSTEKIKPGIKLLSGIYQLQVTAPDKKITSLKVVVK